MTVYTIVGIGDSIMQSVWPKRFSWLNIAADLMTKRDIAAGNQNFWQAVNLGMGGYAPSQMLGMYEKALTVNADMFVICAGANGYSEINTYIGAMIDDLKQNHGYSGSQIVLCTYPPVKPYSLGNGLDASFTATFREMARQASMINTALAISKGVGLFDLYNPFVSGWTTSSTNSEDILINSFRWDFITKNDVHPSKAGNYRIAASLVYQ